MKRFAAGLVVLASAVTLSAQPSSKWVYFGDEHRLHYRTDPRGNRIMDFSHAGYKGGGVALPIVRVARTLTPAPGDNASRIQAAIDEVSRLAPDAGEFRGAVLLAPGTYEVAGALRIAASGVVLRGSGVGWAVAWNVNAMNWCIGCTGRHTPVSWNGSAVPVPEIPSETFESPVVPVSPQSLYLWQLRERLR